MNSSGEEYGKVSRFLQKLTDDKHMLETGYDQYEKHNHDMSSLLNLVRIIQQLKRSK